MNANPTARVDVPADHRWSHVVRAVVAAVADPTEFDIDRIHDLDLAVAEASSAMFDVAGGTRLEVGANRRDGGLRVEMHLAVDPEQQPEETAPLLGYVLEGLAGDIVLSPWMVGFTVSTH